MSITLDHFDHQLLYQLSRDSAQTNHDLAERIGLSASQCSRRKARLIELGIIQGYRARINNQAMGLELRAVIRINLSSHSEDHAKAFHRLVTNSQEIVAAYSVSGDADYVLLTLSRNLTEFADFIHTVLLPFANVSQVRSEIVLQTIKDIT